MGVLADEGDKAGKRTLAGMERSSAAMIVHPSLKTAHIVNPVFLAPGPDAFDPLFGLPIMDPVEVTPGGILDVSNDGTGANE